MPKIPKRSTQLCASRVPMSVSRSVRVTNSELNSDTITPSPSTTAKPMMKVAPNRLPKK